MILRFTHLSLIFLIVLVALAGCDRAQRMITNDMPAEFTMDEPMPGTPVKLVWFINYPENGKDAYIQWIVSIAATLQAPQEVVRIRSYDNVESNVRPHRLVEFEFNSFLDMATYLNRPEIAELLEELPNHSSDTIVHTFIQRSDYATGEAGDWQIKIINLVDYPLGGKQVYLEWVDSISAVLVAPSQVKVITSYDNYYGESPHRLVEFEFTTEEDADTYEALQEIDAVKAELDDRTSSWRLLRFKLRSDYINTAIPSAK